MGILRRRSRRLERKARRAARPRWVKLLVLGVAIMGVGIFALVNRFWPGMPGLDQLWPVFPMLGGMALLLGVVANGFKDSGPVFPGVAALGVGTFFLLITVGPLRFEQLDVLWPVFPLIGGMAFFWSWAASLGRKMALLIPAVLAGGVGVLGLLFTLTPFAKIIGAVGWPLFLLLGGMAVALVAVLGQAGRWLKLAS